ncbi:MAG: aminoacyl-tRNA hydrolase [Clostridia bacterium]|nr:aminoacyl-tRNA hydrolase [Clostridia bacterium]
MFSFLKKNRDASQLCAVVGLGNFGAQYEATRHNAGFIAVDAMADALGASFRKNHRVNAMVADVRIGEKKVLLVKPLTFMNKSGEAVAALLRYYKVAPESVLVIYDDIDLAPGILRIRKEGSAGTHNGMRSVTGVTGTQKFPRIRIGVGAQPKGGDLVKHVMSRIPEESRQAAVRAAEAAQDWVKNGTEHAMSHFNGSV